MTPNPTHHAGGAGAVKVKPLEWSIWPEDGTACSEGQNPQRSFRERAIGVHGAYFLMWKDGAYSIKFGLSGDDLKGMWIEAALAKAAAQADYEARILSALSSTPPAPEPEAEGEAVAWRWRLKDRADKWRVENWKPRNSTEGLVVEPLYTRPCSEAEIADLRAKLASAIKERDSWKGSFDDAHRALVSQEAETQAAEAKLDEMRQALEAVTDATSSYLPPDGISAHECINRVLAATDNPEINAVMIGERNGTP